MHPKITLHKVGYWCDTREITASAKKAREEGLAALLRKNPNALDGLTPIAFPHPAKLVSKRPIKDRLAIGAYLRRGHPIHWWPGYSYCRFPDGPPDDQMGSSDLTDGTWIWPEGLPIYVEQYNVELPDEFIAHMRSAGFVPPPCAGLLWENVEINVKKWLMWADRFKDLDYALRSVPERPPGKDRSG